MSLQTKLDTLSCRTYILVWSWTLVFVVWEGWVWVWVILSGNQSIQYSKVLLKTLYPNGF